MGKFVSLHADGRKYANLLDQLSNFVCEKDDAICEVGCGMGLISCAMAMLWPESNVVGIDRIQEAVKGARLHALEQGLSNIEFVKADIGEEVPGNLEKRFNLVVCPWVMHELVPSLTEFAPLPDEEREAITNVASLVAPGGHLLTVDRLPSGQEQQRPMLDELEDCGLDVIERTTLQEDWETFPMALLSKK